MRRVYLSIAALLLFGCGSVTTQENSNSTTTNETTLNKEIKVVDYATDPAIETETKAFLKMLNNSGGKPMETMQPADARKVLEGAQASVKADISGVEVSEKTIRTG